MTASRLLSRRLFVSALSLGVVSVLPSTSLADNPIVQTNYTADPAPMVYEGRLYLYTTHDEDVTVNNFYTMNDWRVYSTADMVNWTDHGSPLSYQSFSWGKGDAWAGQCIPRNGKFYFYVPMNNASGAKIGVAVSTGPTGPFSDPLGRALVSTGTGDIDPTVYIDDDGQAYLYWGNPNLWYVLLNEDMISYQGTPTKVSLTTEGFGTRSNTDRATAYEEGPWFYRRGSLYYIVYPADGVPEKISYTTSSDPLGPWTYRGDIMAKESGAGSSSTNHPGVADFQGKSYFFYHNGALPGGGAYKRSVCVEEFTYNADGTIPTIRMTTEGPAAVATLNPFEQVEAETIAFSSGLKTEACTDTGGGMNVTSISNGDYIKVMNVDFLNGVTSFEARVSSAGSDAKIELHLDSQTGSLLGTCDVSGVSSWTTKTCSVSGASGKHDLFLTFVGGSDDLFKFNWWKFGGPGDAASDKGRCGCRVAGGRSSSGPLAWGVLGLLALRLLRRRPGMGLRPDRRAHGPSAT
jgi:arabinoxylan arabinofuranohydrolase